MLRGMPINLLFLYLSFISRGETLAIPNWPKNNNSAELTSASTSLNSNFLPEIRSNNMYRLTCFKEGRSFMNLLNKNAYKKVI